MYSATFDHHHRGFGGDNVYYNLHGGPYNGRLANVAINWALLHPYETIVFIDKHEVWRSHEDAGRYVFPAEALAALDYEVDQDFTFTDWQAL